MEVALIFLREEEVAFSSVMHRLFGLKAPFHFLKMSKTTKNFGGLSVVD